MQPLSECGKESYISSGKPLHKVSTKENISEGSKYKPPKGKTVAKLSSNRCRINALID
jgi:hypothetical protein